MDKNMSFMGAMRHFFGMLPDQKLTEFAAEIKALSPEDRAYFQAGLEANGYVITNSPA